MPVLPTVTGVFTHAFAVQASVVHATLSLQCAAVVHGTHWRAPLAPMQCGLAALQPVSVPDPLSMHASHSAGSAPLQTPPVQLVPTLTVGFEHTPAVHTSVVQVLLSLQSAPVRHAVQELTPAMLVTQ